MIVWPNLVSVVGVGVGVGDDDVAAAAAVAVVVAGGEKGEDLRLLLDRL